MKTLLPNSLRTHLGAIFLGFLALVMASVAATFLAVRTQAADAVVINLAGRQRMLTQKMTWLALAQPEDPELASSIQLFDQTLRALNDGGPTLDSLGRVVTLPPAPDPTLGAQLDEAAQTWTTFRSHLQPVNAAALQTYSPLILSQLDASVSAFEVHAQTKLRRLQFIQLAFFFTALLLLGWGYHLTRRRILQPLAALGVTARRMAGGQLTDPVPAMRTDELGELGMAFEAMRVEIAAAQDQLENRVVQRTRELTSAFEFSQEIVAQLEVEHLLRSATDRARALMRAQAVSMCWLTTDGGYLNLVASSSETTGQFNLQQSAQSGLAARVIGAGETVVSEAACSACGFLGAHAPGHCIAAPLRVSEHTLGALCAVRNTGQPFDADERRALTLLANAAAIAIANARLAEAGRRQAEQAAALSEREHLAAELHDNLAQTLSFLRLKVDRAKERLAAGQAVEVDTELERMIPAIGQAYGQVRAALVGLREPTVSYDLAEKLAACVADFRQITGLPAELNVADPSVLALPQLAQRQAWHIVREALTNVRRHAQARQVWVRVERVNGAARFTVKDDGCGFEPQAIATDSHLGLAIMRARADRCGGQLSIDSILGIGTKIVATFPLKPVGGSLEQPHDSRSDSACRR